MTDDLSTDYEWAGFRGSLGFGASPALLVVDFVMGYLDPTSPLYAGVEDTVESGARVLAAARAAGIPVVFTQVVYKPGGLDGGIWFKKVKSLESFVEGSPLGEIVPELTPLAEEVVVTKQYASAFFGTSLASTLNAMRVDTVILIGLSTSGCVRASATDALQYGFIPIVVREAVGDRDETVQEANLFDLNAKYADVVSESIVVEWLGSRGSG